MRMIMIVPLMIFFISCESAKIGVYRLCDFSLQFDRCRCRNYDLDKIKAASEPVNYPIEECEGLMGFFPEDVAEHILPKVKRAVRACEDQGDF